jgi:dTDP-4-dehydrorhamnose reductase
MKLIVLGSNGLLGNKIVEKALEPTPLMTFDVVALDKDDLDISKQDDVLKYICRPENIGCTIINCAAVTNTKLGSVEIQNTNVLGPLNLADAAACVQGRLIHISSDYVFWQPVKKAVPGSENLYTPLGAHRYSRVDPIPEEQFGNRYAASKLLAEQFLKDKPCHKFIVRTSWVYGSGKTKAPSGFVSFIMRNLLREQRIPIDTIQVGIPTPVSYLAKQILKGAAIGKTGIEHIVGAHTESRYTWAAKIAGYLDEFEGTDTKYQNLISFSINHDSQKLVPVCTLLEHSSGFPYQNGSEIEDIMELYKQTKAELDG